MEIIQRDLLGTIPLSYLAHELERLKRSRRIATYFSFNGMTLVVPRLMAVAMIEQAVIDR